MICERFLAEKTKGILRLKFRIEAEEDGARMRCCLFSDACGRLFVCKGEFLMNVMAIIGILVQSDCCTSGLNAILSDFGEYIVARTGVPCRASGLNVISIIIDAPMDKINALSGKLGKLQGISAKTVTLSKQNA